MRTLLLSFSILLFIGCKKSETPPEYKKIWEVKYDILCNEQDFINGSYTDFNGARTAILGYPGLPVHVLNVDDPWPATPWTKTITINPLVDTTQVVALGFYHAAHSLLGSLYTLRITVNGEIATEYTANVHEDHWGISYNLKTKERLLGGIQYVVPNQFYP